MNKINQNLIFISRQSILVFLGNIIDVSLNFIFNYIAARYLGETIYGQFIYVFTFVSFLGNIIKLGIDSGVVYFLPKREIRQNIEKMRSIISFFYSILFLLNTIILILIASFSKKISTIILNAPELQKLVLQIALFSLMISSIHLAKGIFRGLENIKPIILAQNIFQPIIRVIFLILLIAFSLKKESMIFSYYAGYVGALSIIFYFLKKKNLIFQFSLEDLPLFKKIFLYSLPIFLTGIINFALSNTDIYMIGYFLDRSKVGIYNIALKVASFSTFFLVSVNTIFAPIISRLFQKNDFNEIQHLFKNLTFWIFNLNVFYFLGIFFLGKEVLNLFGLTFKTGYWPLVLIGISQLVNSGVGSAGYILIMTEKQKIEFYNSLINLTLNVLLNLLLIPRLGIVGAAIATMTSIIISNLLRLFFVYYFYRIHPYNTKFIKAMMIQFINFFFLYVTFFYFHAVTLIKIGIILGTTLLISIIGYLFFLKDAEDAWILDLAKSIFKKS